MFPAALKFFCAVIGLLTTVAGETAEFKYNDALNDIFGEHAGVLAVKELNSCEVLTSDADRLTKRFSPASTFKIAHALIALDLGIVSDTEEVFFNYDGHSRYFLSSWQKDMGLKEAVQTSNVAAFKVMAAKIGNTRMQQALAALDYGNGAIGTDVTSFWLDGTLQISALEQIVFLEKLINEELPCSKTAQQEVAEILKLEETDNYTLYGKTGLSSGAEAIGWYVGFVRKPDKIYIFALNLDMDDDMPGELRTKLVRYGLEILNLI